MIELVAVRAMVVEQIKEEIGDNSARRAEIATVTIRMTYTCPFDVC